MQSSWFIAPLTNQHEKGNFNCGEIALNSYLKQLASQHAKSKLSKTFIAASKNVPDKVLGYYTLSAGSITFQQLPEKWQKKLPRYPISIARIGRLGVDQSMQGQGLGKYLLMDALYRCVRLTEEIGIIGVVVDAKHEKAKNFYLQYGFSELTELPLTLFVPIQVIVKSMED